MKNIKQKIEDKIYMLLAIIFLILFLVTLPLTYPISKIWDLIDKKRLTKEEYNKRYWKSGF